MKPATLRKLTLIAERVLRDDLLRKRKQNEEAWRDTGASIIC